MLRRKRRICARESLSGDLTCGVVVLAQCIRWPPFGKYVKMHSAAFASFPLEVSVKASPTLKKASGNTAAKSVSTLASRRSTLPATVTHAPPARNFRSVPVFPAKSPARLARAASGACRQRVAGARSRRSCAAGGAFGRVAFIAARGIVAGADSYRTGSRHGGLLGRMRLPSPSGVTSGLARGSIVPTRGRGNNSSHMRRFT